VIFIVVKWSVRPERSDTFLQDVAEFTTATRAEPGNLFFEWSRSVEDPHEFVLLEAFQDDAAGPHVDSEHFKKAMAELGGTVTEQPRVINFQVPGDDWSRLGELQLND
jgi:quinol monooxygenase YgiN